MITKEQLENASQAGKYKNGSRVLTRDEAAQHCKAFGRITVVSDRSVFFYTNDHRFGYGILGKDFVPYSTALPMRVAPRPGLENGIIDTLGKYELVFENDTRCIESIDVLIDYVNIKNLNRKD